MTHKIYVFTAFSLLPIKYLIRRCFLIYLKNNSPLRQCNRRPARCNERASDSGRPTALHCLCSAMATLGHSQALRLVPLFSHSVFQRLDRRPYWWPCINGHWHIVSLVHLHTTSLLLHARQSCVHFFHRGVRLYGLPFCFFLRTPAKLNTPYR